MAEVNELEAAGELIKPGVWSAAPTLTLQRPFDARSDHVQTRRFGGICPSFVLDDQVDTFVLPRRVVIVKGHRRRGSLPGQDYNFSTSPIQAEFPLPIVNPWTFPERFVLLLHDGVVVERVRPPISQPPVRGETPSEKGSGPEVAEIGGAQIGV